MIAVAGSPFDFLKPITAGSRIDEAGGYDINFVLDLPLDEQDLRKAAVVENESSRMKMELWTNQPGVQFYTANIIKDVKGKGGSVYLQYGAKCLETQGFPDSVNHPGFPSMIVNPGENYKHIMVYKFSFA